MFGLKFNLRDSQLNNLVCTEKVNMKTLDLLINSTLLKQTFRNPYVKYENEKQQLEKYNRLFEIQKDNEDIGIADIFYTRRYNIGRVNPIKSLGLHCIRREIRHTLARDFYKDIDIVNAHCVILEQICNMNNINTKYLKKYNANRDTIIKDLMAYYNLPKDNIKNLFIRLLYLGDVEYWAKDNDINKEEEHDQFILKYSKELKKIGEIIYKKNKHLVKDVKKDDVDEDVDNWGDNSSKEMRRVVAYVLQEIECQCLELVYSYCVENKIISFEKPSSVLCNDGLMIENESLEVINEQELLNTFSKIIKDKLGLDLKFIIKEFNQGYSIEELENSQFVSINPDTFNQSRMAEIFYNSYKNKYMFCEHLGWYELLDSNILHNSRTNYPISFSKLIPKCIDYHAYKIIDKNNDRIIDCHKQINLIKKDNQKDKDEKERDIRNSEEIIKSLNTLNKQLLNIIQKVGNSSFISGVSEMMREKYYVKDISEKIDSNIKLLAFDNFVYDYELEKFRCIRPNDYISITTGYNLKCKTFRDSKGYISTIEPIRNNEIKQDIDIVISSLFSSVEMKNYFMASLSKSLFSNDAESLYIWLGSGGNGKGLVSTLLEKTLGKYYYTCGNTFLTSKTKSSTESNSTLVNLKGVRIASVSEPDDGAGDGGTFNIGLVKSLTGKDSITARDLFKSNITFKPQFNLFLQCNKLPKINNTDDGISRRLKIVDFPYSFVDNPTREHHKQIDRSLKNRFNQDYYNEFILMLIDESLKWKNKDIPTPQIIQENVNSYIQDNDPLALWFNAYINITKDKNDKFKVSELQKHYVSKYDNQMTPKKFNEYLKPHLYRNNLEIKINKGYNYVYGVSINKDDDDVTTEDCLDV